MSKKLNLLSKKKKFMYGLSIAFSIIVMSVISCTKEKDVVSSKEENSTLARISGSGSSTTTASPFIVCDVSASTQTFYISCPCDPTFTVTPTTSLMYGATTSTTVVVSTASFSSTLVKK